VFVPLTKMPLSPNGKIDKNALPFPDTALLGNETESDDSEWTSIQKSMRSMWSVILNRSIASIGLEDNFFDLGGHSILATRLIFDMRQHLAVDVPLGILFKTPTLKTLSDEIEHLRSMNLAGEAVSESSSLTMKKPKPFTRSGSDLPLGDNDYANEVHLEMKKWKIPCNLPEFKFPIQEKEPLQGPVVFITGVTGFLGAFILSAMAKRYPHAKLLCHVRAKTKEDGFRRILENCERHLVKVNENQIIPVCGDLGLPRLGLSQPHWDQLSEQVDIIIHNGALVHWIYPYSKLKAANVCGTLETLTLACTHHLKPLYFVSSTSVLDTPNYVERQGVVMESDDLSRSAKGLHSGYAQSKWVAEKIIMEARRRGVKACIIRPGYIVGDSKTGGTCLSIIHKNSGKCG
jgi:L-aminoadipate-semialdehyde dehydrogenase